MNSSQNIEAERIDIMVAKLRKLSTETKQTWYIMMKYLPPLIAETFISTFIYWFNYFIVSLLAIFYAMLITSVKGDEMNNFFPPNFGWGLLCAFATIFLYKLAVESSQKIHSSVTEARKRTFKDIEITSFIFPDESGFNGVGLNVSSFKPILGDYYVNELIGKIVLISLNGKEAGRFSFNEGIELPLIVKQGIMFEINHNKIVARKNYDKGTSTILFLGEEQNIIKNDGDICFVTVEMKARVGDLNMEGCLVRFKIYHDKNTGKLLISNLERFPEFEK